MLRNVFVNVLITWGRNKKNVKSQHSFFLVRKGECIEKNEYVLVLAVLQDVHKIPKYLFLTGELQSLQDISWYLYKKVAQNRLRTYGETRYFDLLEAFGYIERIVK